MLDIGSNNFSRYEKYLFAMFPRESNKQGLMVDLVRNSLHRDDFATPS